ncbi:MAG: hypothetical protein QXI71_02580 [Candidatus Bathyarchaeia archaeon]|nr:hypothetical protein [Candidatus Bathyarchaeota archaeon]
MALEPIWGIFGLACGTMGILVGMFSKWASLNKLEVRNKSGEKANLDTIKAIMEDFKYRLEKTEITEINSTTNTKPACAIF